MKSELNEPHCRKSFHTPWKTKLEHLSVLVCRAEFLKNYHSLCTWKIRTVLWFLSTAGVTAPPFPWQCEEHQSLCTHRCMVKPGTLAHQVQICAKWPSISCSTYSYPYTNTELCGGVGVFCFVLFLDLFFKEKWMFSSQLQQKQLCFHSGYFLILCVSFKNEVGTLMRRAGWHYIAVVV